MSKKEAPSPDKSEIVPESTTEASVLDWIKSVFKGRPIPISGEVSGVKSVPHSGTVISREISDQTVEAIPTLPSPSRRIPKAKVPIRQSLRKLLQNLLTVQPWRGFVFIGAWIIVVYELLRLPAMPQDGNFTLISIAWILSFCLYAVAFAFPSSKPSGGRGLLGNTKWIVLALVVVSLTAFSLRIWNIGKIPFALSGDEASQGLEAERVIKGELRNPFTTSWSSVPTMTFFFNSLSIRALGRTIVGLRVPWALVGTATVIVAFFIVALLYGPRMGLATAALLATYHYHIHYSRVGSNQIADPFFAGLSLFFFFNAIKRRSLMSWIFFGAIVALALNFYSGARFVVVLAVMIIAYKLLTERNRFWIPHRLGLLVALGSFIIVAAPMIQYAVRFPDDFNARVNQIGIIQSGWLEREEEILGESTITILFDQFRRSALAFNYYSDRTVWYGLEQPLLDPIFGALFLLGLGYSTVHGIIPGGNKRLFPMVAWWWGATILGGMMTESPPSSMRLTTLTIPVCFFIMLAMWKIILLAKKAFANFPSNSVLFTGIALFAFISLRTYFQEFTPQRITGGSRAELATEIAPLLNDLKATHQIYFVGAPWMYWGFATLPYLVPDAEVFDIIEPLESPSSITPPPEGKGALFIVLSERFDELQVIRDTLPNGDEMVIFGATEEEVLGLIYRVPP